MELSYAEIKRIAEKIGFQFVVMQCWGDWMKEEEEGGIAELTWLTLCVCVCVV